MDNDSGVFGEATDQLTVTATMPIREAAFRGLPTETRRQKFLGGLIMLALIVSVCVGFWLLNDWSGAKVAPGGCDASSPYITQPASWTDSHGQKWLNPCDPRNEPDPPDQSGA